MERDELRDALSEFWDGSGDSARRDDFMANVIDAYVAAERERADKAEIEVRKMKARPGSRFVISLEERALAAEAALERVRKLVARRGPGTQWLTAHDVRQAVEGGANNAA